MPAAAGALAPSWVGEYGAECWTSLSPILERAGLLSEGDLPAFALLCSEYDGMRKDPLDKGSRERYRRLLIEFGLTPTSRSRLRAVAEPPKDDLEQFLLSKGR